MVTYELQNKEPNEKSIRENQREQDECTTTRQGIQANLRGIAVMKGNKRPKAPKYGSPAKGARSFKGLKGSASNLK